MPQTKGSHAKKSRANKARARTRRRKALPVLGAAGLSLSLAGAAAAATATPQSAPQASVTQQINLVEEEISDVSLATFYVFDKENPGARRPGVRFAMGACGGMGCGGCGCWTGTYYSSSVFGDDAVPPPPRPKHKHSKPAQSSAPKPTVGSKGS